MKFKKSTENQNWLEAKVNVVQSQIRRDLSAQGCASKTLKEGRTLMVSGGGKKSRAVKSGGRSIGLLDLGIIAKYDYEKKVRVSSKSNCPIYWIRVTSL